MASVRFIAFLAATLAGSVEGTDLDRATNNWQAIEQFFETFEKSGMNGVEEFVVDCYRNVRKQKILRQLEFCFAFHVSAMIWDEQMSKVANFPRNQFFTYDNVDEHVRRGLDFIAYPQEKRKEFLNFVSQMTFRTFNEVVKIWVETLKKRDSTSK